MSGRTETSFPARPDSITFLQKEWNTAEQNIKETLLTIKSLNLHEENLLSSAQVLETEVEKLETLVEQVNGALERQKASCFCGYSRDKAYGRAFKFVQLGSWITTAVSLGCTNIPNNSSSQNGTFKWVAFGASMSGPFFTGVNEIIKRRWEKKEKAKDQLDALLQRRLLICKTQTIIHRCKTLDVAAPQSSTTSSSELLTNDNKLGDFSATKLQELIELIDQLFPQERGSPVEHLLDRQSTSFSLSQGGRESPNGFLLKEKSKDPSPVQEGTRSSRSSQAARSEDVSRCQIREGLPLRLAATTQFHAGRGSPVTRSGSSGSKGGKESVVPLSGGTLLNTESLIRSYPSLTGS